MSQLGLVLQGKIISTTISASIITSAWIPSKSRTGIYYLPKIFITTVSLVSTVHLFILRGTDHISSWVSFSLNSIVWGVLCYGVSVEHSAHFSTGSYMSLSYAMCIQCCIPFREKTLRSVQGKTYCSLNLLRGYISLNSSRSSTWHGTGNHQDPKAAMSLVRHPYLTADKTFTKLIGVKMISVKPYPLLLPHTCKTGRKQGGASDYLF